MKPLLLVLSPAALLVAATAYAADTRLIEDQVEAKVEAAGYTNVHGIEPEGKHFDADATKDGKPVHLHVDANTGAITPAPHEDEEKHDKDSAANSQFPIVSIQSPESKA
jgi:hypothetical protein